MCLGKVEQVMEVEERLRYRIYIKLFNKHCIVLLLPDCLTLPHTHTQTHTHAHRPTQVPRWVVDKEKRTAISRHRQLNVYSEICTFLIIKLCHLNEQTPAKVLY